MSWHEDGHSAALVVDEDMLRVKLQCPGPEFCESRQRCHVCEGEGTVANGPHHSVGSWKELMEPQDPPIYTRDPCEHCGGSGNEPDTCHLMHWAEHVDPMEMHTGHTDLYGQVFPAAIRWQYGGDEGPNWRFAVTYPDERQEVPNEPVRRV